MKLLLIFAAVLAFSLAEEEAKKEILDDSEAEASASIELMKEGADLHSAASTYNTYIPPSQRPPQWNVPNVVQPPQNTWTPPHHETVKPIQPINTGVPANVQNDYYDYHHHHHHQPQWSTPIYHPPTTTTPVSVIKNEQYFGENGYYKYEYQIADGTHVGEEGYYTSPKQDEDSLVKRGWYSYVGADGKTYTVTYWADKTGYHAYGAHLPTAPPVPKAIQDALDNQKEADKYKPQYDYPAPTQTTPAPIFYPTQSPAPVHYPSQAPYIPPQQPTYVPPPQPTYQPPHQHSYPQQSQYPQYPPHQTHYPQQPAY